MAIATRVSLEEYLDTSYEPDCDFVDGVLEERNVGMKKHARTQIRVAMWLAAKTQQRGYEALVEQRVKVGPTRVRVPDVCLSLLNDNDEVTQEPPPLCVEVLSPEDRWKRLEVRVRDYLAFGVPTIWIIDPYSKRAWIGTQETDITEVTDGILRCANPSLELRVSDILPKE